MLQPDYWGKDNTLLHSSFSCLKLRSDKEKAIVLLPGHCGNAGNGTASSTKPLTPKISRLLPALMKILCSAVHPSPPTPGFPQVSHGGQIKTEENGVSVIICVTNHNSFITSNGRLLELAGSWTVQWDPVDEKMICVFFPISPKCPTCSTDTAWTVEPGSCYTEHLHPGLGLCQCRRLAGKFKVWTQRHFQSLARRQGHYVGLYRCVLCHITQTFVAHGHNRDP